MNAIDLASPADDNIKADGRALFGAHGRGSSFEHVKFGRSARNEQIDDLHVQETS